MPCDVSLASTESAIVPAYGVSCGAGTFACGLTSALAAAAVSASVNAKTRRVGCIGRANAYIGGSSQAGQANRRTGSRNPSTVAPRFAAPIGRTAQKMRRSDLIAVSRQRALANAVTE